MHPASSSVQDNQDSTLGDAVAQKAVDVYAKLPKHGKPTIRSNGIPEWTILATISLVITESFPPRIIPISLGSGVKVLPASKLPPLGDTLHDCHAEILARRGFVTWLIHEAGRVTRGEENEDVLELREGKFGLKSGVEVWLYVSTLPCGDASTLHTAAYQPADMAALKSQNTPEVETDNTHAVRGRNGYQNFGAIRTKPGRADSIPSISMSCSDKIAGWSVLGIQGGLLDPIFWPVYLGHIVVGGVEADPPKGCSSGGSWKETIRSELERASWGRLDPLEGTLPWPYTLHRPIVHLTTVAFPFSKPIVAQSTTSEPVTSMLCLSHAPQLSPTPEVIFNGGKQSGSWKSPGHILIAEKKRTRICKFSVMVAYIDLLEQLRLSGIVKSDDVEPNTTYYDLKHRADSAYQRAKTLLRGVPRSSNNLHSKFGEIGSFEITEAESTGHTPPFGGWIVAGRSFQSFTRDGRLMQGDEY